MGWFPFAMLPSFCSVKGHAGWAGMTQICRQLFLCIGHTPERTGDGAIRN